VSAAASEIEIVMRRGKRPQFFARFAMDGIKTGVLRLAVLALLVIVVLPAGGCVGLAAQLLYAWKGDMVPAEYAGLEGKQVAVVCVADSSAYGPSPVARLLAARVERVLAVNVKNIRPIDQDKVADWLDTNDWDQIDFREIGRGVGAERLIVIELAGFSLHADPTLYRGTADVTLRVYDIADGGKEVFHRTPPPIVFPRNAGKHVTETRESEFRNLFLDEVAGQVARYFHPYDIKEEFARDTEILRR
jgi:hypothetical protein